MKPKEQERFRAKGEQVALEIKSMLDAGKAHFKKITHLIMEWLKLIPGVNKFFLQKEAKRKTDDLIRKHEEKKEHMGMFGILIAQAAPLFGPGGTNPATHPSTTTDPLATILPIVLIVIAAIGAVIALLFLIRHFMRSRHEFGSGSHQITLLLSIPKEQQLKDKAGDVGIEAIRAQIAIAEALFSNIGGLKAERGFSAWFFGRADQMSFEIVVLKGMIHFYITTPQKYKDFLEQQLQAQYPSAQLEEVDDYNFFNPKDSIIGAQLKYTKPFTYPFKTYKQTETDPLNGLLNPLTKIGEDSGVAIQYVVRSAHKKWRSHSKKDSKELTEGKKGNDNDYIGKFTDVVAMAHGGKTRDKEDMKPNTPTALEQETAKNIDEKQSRAGLDCNARIIVSAPSDNIANIILKNLVNSFAQYNLYQTGNSFKAEVPARPNKLINQFIYRHFDEKYNMLTNTEELASLWHPPTPYTEVPNIKWLGSRSAVPPQDMPEEGTLLGFNIFRRKRTEVMIKRKDRRRHLYAIGMTGTGKSTLLSNMASKDAVAGEGLCAMDPHGEFADSIIGTIPPERIDDVVYFSPGDTGRPFGLNMLEFDPAFPEQKTFVINEFIAILDRLYNLKETGGPMFETYLRNSILLNMGHPESGNTIMEISKVLADEDFRRFKLSKCENKPVVDFWVKEAEKAGGEASLQNMVPYITSKLNQFIGNDVMRPIIAQQKSTLNFRKIMDDQQILLVNLSKGKLGEMNSNLLGMIVIGKLLMAALSRVDTPEEDRKDFYVYLDEFQNFLTDTVDTILAEARKYRLILNIAHQFIGQLEEMPTIKDSIFGNVGTKVAFRIGVDDAEFLAKEFEPVFNQNDLMNVPARNAYIKMMVNGSASVPFNMATYAPPSQDAELAEALKEISRLTYGRDREIVEREIKARAID